MNLLLSILSVALAAAPWLLLGLVAAGLVKGLIPETVMRRWLGGDGLVAIVRGAVIGAPLPLCSCGAIPTALALHRGGAGRGPTTAFLISTPGVGVDSVAISYALLGPWMVVARIAGAFVTAVATALLVVAASPSRHQPPAAVTAECSGCGDADCAVRDATALSPGQHLRAGIHYAFTDLLDDIKGWLVAGLLLAGLLVTLLPPEALAAHGSGLVAMGVMALVGIPLYLCATAATPIAAALLLAGLSPGTVLVFLLAAPITSVATLVLLRRELGSRALLAYLSGIVVTTIAVGLVTDLLVAQAGLDIVAQARAVRELLPGWLEWIALLLLLALILRTPYRRLLAQ